VTTAQYCAYFMLRRFGLIIKLSKEKSNSFEKKGLSAFEKKIRSAFEKGRKQIIRNKLKNKIKKRKWRTSS